MTTFAFCRGASVWVAFCTTLAAFNWRLVLGAWFLVFVAVVLLLNAEVRAAERGEPR